MAYICTHHTLGWEQNVGVPALLFVLSKLKSHPLIGNVRHCARFVTWDWHLTGTIEGVNEPDFAPSLINTRCSG